MTENSQWNSSSYKYGFSTKIEQESFPAGLNEDVVRALSAKKKEPRFLLDFRLRAFALWQKMSPPSWGRLSIDPIDFQAIKYYSAPKKKQSLASLDEVDPELLKTLERLGIPLEEQKRLTGVAVDVVFDSVSLGTVFRESLEASGVTLCSMSEAVHRFPDLVEKYLGSVVPAGDNFFSALNSAVFSDGSFVHVPKGVRCPVELSTYFRINDQEVGQFERTLIIAEDDSYVSYLEGCTAPAYDRHQLHAAVVELVTDHRAEIKYSTVQNWYPGDPETGKGGIYNFVTKRGKCVGQNSKISWVQVEVGAAITWKYPSCLLLGDGSVGEFYSVALTNGRMQADTGTKMVHVGKNTTSTVMSKGISAECSSNTYRGLVKIAPQATGSRNYTQCDSMLVGDNSTAVTLPFIDVANMSSSIEHEASTSKMNEDQIFYLRSRGIQQEEAINMIVNGFCQNVFQKLPLEFAAEAQKLLSIKLENSVG